MKTADENEILSRKIEKDENVWVEFNKNENGKLNEIKFFVYCIDAQETRSFSVTFWTKKTEETVMISGTKFCPSNSFHNYLIADKISARPFQPLFLLFWFSLFRSFMSTVNASRGPVSKISLKKIRHKTFFFSRKIIAKFFWVTNLKMNDFSRLIFLLF